MDTINLQQVSSYRTVYLLNDINEKTGLLRATHCAMVLSGGSTPVWGVFILTDGRLIQCWGSRSQVEEAYPKKAWRRKQATWGLQSVQEMLDNEAKNMALSSQIQKKPTSSTAG